MTITRETSTGLLETITTVGWRSENKINELGLEKLLFEPETAQKELIKLRNDFRCAKMKKSLRLNR